MSLQDLRERYPELYTQLEIVAHKRTIPFCYLCYVDAPSGMCVRCGTDDLMRHLPGVGVEYGYEWVIEHLLDQEVEDITPEQQEELFMEFIDSCYNEETQVAFITVDTAWALKELDPVAFGIAMNDFFMEDAHIEIWGKLYCVTTIDTWVEEQLEQFLKPPEKEGQECTGLRYL